MILILMPSLSIQLSHAQPQGSNPVGTPQTKMPSTMLEATSTSHILSQRRGTINRSSVEQVVRGGVPRLLAQVRLVPARYAGKFVGFKLARLTQEALAIRAGFQKEDIIMSVNGEPIGRPDQMMHALSLLPFAPRLTIRFKRSGSVLEWTWAIIP